MGLAPGRVETVIIEQFDSPEAYSEATGSVKTVSGYYDIPGGEARLIEEEVQVINSMGRVIRKTIDSWDIEHAYASPSAHTKETYATIWLPARGHRTGLNLVDRVTTVFWWASIYAQQGGYQSYREVREGEVIYNTIPSSHPPTAEELAKLKKQGRYVADALNIQVILNSARSWDSALSSNGIVEDAEYPQTSMWKRISTTEHMVHDTWSDIVEYTIKHNHLNPGDVSIDGPKVTKKPGIKFEIPVPISPPTLTDASEYGTGGVFLRAESGGGFLGPITFNGKTVVIRPDTYKFYRRVDSMPGRSLDDDPYNLWDTPPSADNKFGIPPIEGVVTDSSGAPLADSLPSPVAPGESDDTSEPDEDHWTLVAEIDNAEEQKTLDGWAAVVDLDVVQNAEYTYRATVVCNGEESEPSNELSLTYTLATVSQGIVATVRTNGDGNIEIDVVAPSNIEVENSNPNLPDDYGETVAIKAPVDLGRTGSGEIEEEDIDDAAQALGIEIAQAQMVRSQGLRRIQITPVVPILGIQRGSIITAPALSWKTLGNDLVINSSTVQTTLRVDGWGLKVSNNNGNFTVISDPLDCLEVSV